MISKERMAIAGIAHLLYMNRDGCTVKIAEGIGNPPIPEYVWAEHDINDEPGVPIGVGDYVVAIDNTLVVPEVSYEYVHERLNALVDRAQCRPLGFGIWINDEGMHEMSTVWFGDLETCINIAQSRSEDYIYSLRDRELINAG